MAHQDYGGGGGASSGGFEELLGIGGAAAGAIGGPIGIGIAVGANLASGLLRVRSQRARQRKLRTARLEAIRPLEGLLRATQYGPTLAESAAREQAGTQARQDLSSRGLLESSVAPGQVAAATAPFDMLRENRQQLLTQNLVAAKEAIAQDTQLPGFGEAFAGTLGEVGGLAAQYAGGQFERRRLDPQRRRLAERLHMLDLMMQGGGGGSEWSPNVNVPNRRTGSEDFGL